LTINVTGNTTALVLESSSDLANLTVPFANPGTQGLDLNTPTTPAAFNALRIYAPDLTAAKTTLWSAIKNANGPGSLTLTDGIYDSGRVNHPNSGIGLARVNDAHGDGHIQIRLARIGDLNLDGSVTISDFIDLASNFNSSGPNITWQEGDLNYDGSVTISDFIDLAANFNSSYAGVSSAASPSNLHLLSSFASAVGVDSSVIGADTRSTGSPAVPEPGGVALLSISVCGVLASRRKTITNNCWLLTLSSLHQ
jgi:hypothetical protein